MAFGKRRKKPGYRDTVRVYDAKDGLDVNKIKWGWHISSHRHVMSQHDNSSFYERRDGNFRELGIVKRVGRINRYKSLTLNPQIGLLNRKAYNVS